MKIFIDPGHGGSDPGAVNTNLNLKESDVNLDTALRLERILKARGFETKLSRTTDVFVPLTERAAMANNWGADYFISVHSNASVDPNAKGTEVLYYKDSSRAVPLAAAIQEQLILQNGLDDRGIFPRPNLAVLRLTNMPAVLVELGFVSHPTEAKLLMLPEFRQNAAQGIADGLAVYLQEI